MSRLRLIAIAAFALVLALPASVLAATVDVSGTVTAPEGVPVAGVEIAVLVQGTDQIVAAVTDETGAWALQVDAEPGAVLEINATGAQVRSEPDEEGCVTLTTPTGRLELTITELPLAAIELPLDGTITGEECTATATPERTPPLTGVKPDKVKTPDTTPPSTDTLSPPVPGATGSAFLVVMGLLATVSGASIAFGRRHRAQRALVRRFQAHPLDRRPRHRD